MLFNCYLPFADASISENPGAVVPHARICAGTVGQLAVLPQGATPCKTKQSINEE